MQQKPAFSREDKHKPAAIASLRPVWKVFLDVIPRRVRPFGAEGGLTRIGWGWVGARSNCDSLLKACLLLLAVSEAKGQNRTQRGTGSSRPFGASLMLARNEIYGTTLPTHLLAGRNIETGSITFDEHGDRQVDFVLRDLDPRDNTYKARLMLTTVGKTCR